MCCVTFAAIFKLSLIEFQATKTCAWNKTINVLANGFLNFFIFIFFYTFSRMYLNIKILFTGSF